MISYGKLWRMCVEHNIPPYKLFAMIGSSSQTLGDMKKCKNVSLLTIDKICTYFKCQPTEIMEYTADADSR